MEHKHGTLDWYKAQRPKPQEYKLGNFCKAVVEEKIKKHEGKVKVFDLKTREKVELAFDITNPWLFFDFPEDFIRWGNENKNNYTILWWPL